MPSDRRDIYEVAPASLAGWLAEQGEPRYRLKQVLDWLYAARADSFEAMSNLPRDLRRRLDAAFAFPVLREADERKSQDGGSGKFLLELADGGRIECVWMEDGDHRTFCISSQSGCALGCRFCATGAAGAGRNLTTGEIIGQVLHLARARGGTGNIVFMGMGEPLLNLAALLPALEALTDEQRLAIGARRITVSTAGIRPGIRRLCKAAVHPKLALSLGSPFEEQRAELMPVSGRYPLSDVLKACRDYADATGRRLSLQYVLLGSVNTSSAAARAVARIANDLNALLNLIPFNAVPGSGFRSPSQAEVRRFRTVLEQARVNVTERYRRGRGISAACGQLGGWHSPEAARPRRRPRPHDSRKRR